MLKFGVNSKNKKQETQVFSSTLTHRLLRGSSVILFFTFLSSPLAYLLRMLFSRTLSTYDYGLFYAVLGFFSIFTTFNDLGFGYSMAYFIPKFLAKKDYKTCWKLYKYDQYIEFFTSIFISIIFFLTAKPLAAYYFKTLKAENLIYIFTIYFVTNSLVSAMNKLFTGLQKEEYYSSTQFLKVLFTLIISFIFFFFDYGNILTYAFAWSISYILIIIIFSFLLNRNYSYLKNKVLWDKKLFSKMFHYAVPTLLNNSIFLLVASTDTIFLTLFKNVQEVGVLNVILPIVSIPSLFLSPINVLFLPMVSGMMENNKSKVEFLVEKILKLIPFITFYFLLFIVLFPTVSISTLFGYKWAGLVESPLRIFAVGYFFSAILSYLTTVIGGLGLVKQKLKISLQVAVLNIFSGVILTYFYGIAGLALANLLVYATALFLTLKIIRTKLKFKIPHIFYIKLGGIASFCFVFVKIFKINPTSFADFINAGFIYTLFMIAFAIVIKVIDKTTYKIVYQTIHRFVKKYV